MIGHRMEVNIPNIFRPPPFDEMFVLILVFPNINEEIRVCVCSQVGRKEIAK
jgi:hypothetical protein